MTAAINLAELPRVPLEQGLDSRKRFYCTDADHDIPMWLARKTGSKVLYISFHGAIDRTKRQMPVFMPVMPMTGDDANQLVIADPTMHVPGEFTLSWYAGSEGFNLQETLLDLIKRTISHLNIEHVVFMGSSGGGFASLYYSWHFPESTCIAVSAQTNIEKYYAGHVSRYATACWPALPGPSALPDVICSDVASLYRKSVPNNLILLYSSGDTFHVTNHLVPLLDALASHKKPRFILQCDYWGVPDHSRSVPVEVPLKWLNVAVNHPGTSTSELLAAWHSVGQDDAPAQTAPRAAAGSAAPGKALNEHDLRVAQALTASMLTER